MFYSWLEAALQSWMGEYFAGTVVDGKAKERKTGMIVN
jgi:hypothetical protein